MRKTAAIGKCMMVLLITAFTAHAQLPDFHVQVINKRNGVNLAGAFEVIQDNKGYVWILSDDRVQRYDGKSVKIFQPAQALKNIYCDADGGIWCVSEQSVLKFANDHTGFVPVPVDIAARYLYSLHQLSDKSIWCSHTNGLLKYSKTENRFVAHPIPVLPQDASQSAAIRVVEAVHHGSSFCIMKRDSVFVWNAQSGEYKGIPFAKPNFATFINEHKLLLTSYDAITKEWDLASGKLYAAAYQSKKTEPESFFYARRSLSLGPGDCYLVSNKGLLHVTGSVAHAKPLRLFLDGIPLPGAQNIRYISQGRDGRVFLLHESGILYFDRHRQGIETIRNLSADLSRNFGNRPTECLLDERQNLWIGSYDGFARWNLPTNEHRHYKATKSPHNALQHPIVWHLARDGKNMLLAPDQQGLLVFDTEKETFRRPVFASDSAGKALAGLFNSATIYFIVPLRNGNFLVSNRHGVFVVTKETYRVSKLSLPKSGYYLRAVEMEDGSIWFGAMRGLVGTDSNYVFKKQLPMPGADKEVTALCATGNGDLVAGCKQLFRISDPFSDSPAVQPFQPRITGKVISTLYKDRMGYIWVGTADGLYRCHPDNATVHRITSPDHVAGRHQFRNLFEAPDGTVFFCSENGINYFDPSRIDVEDHPLQVFVSNVTVNNDDSSYLLQGTIGPELPFSQNSLVFDFITPHLQPATVQYRYRMRGVDRDWVPAGVNNQVRYAALPPGHYRFEVAASTDGLHWHAALQTVSFTILPPFWRTGWFAALCVLAAGAAAYMLYRYRRKRREEKNAQQLIDYFANSGYEHSSVEDILWDIARNCISRLNFEDCVIYLLDEESGALHQKAAYGPKSPSAFTIMNPIEIPVGEGIVGTVAKTGKPEIVTDTRVDKRYIVDDQPRLSEITVPIIHEGKVIGIIDSEHSRRNFFRAKHVQILQTIAVLCSAKISRAMALDAIRKSKMQLMELNVKMAESKFLNLRLQMNPHFLFNSLSSIQHLVVSEQTSRAYKYLTVFSNLLRAMLKYADSNFISLDNELAMLRMYLDLESLRFDGSFCYSITVDESVEQEEVLIPSLMVQPFAENAIWHGLLHKEGEKKLCIEFNNHQDDYLTCIIEDNGIGREQAAAIQQKKISSMVHESKGIAIIRERLRLLQQKTGKPARVEILDKKDDHLRPVGTKVIIIIPFYNKEEA